MYSLHTCPGAFELDTLMKLTISAWCADLDMSFWWYMAVDQTLVGVTVQVPQKQGPALPIRIRPHGLQNPGASQATRTFGSAPPLQADLGGFPSQVSQDRSAVPAMASCQQQSCATCSEDRDLWFDWSEPCSGLQDPDPACALQG